MILSDVRNVKINFQESGLKVSHFELNKNSDVWFKGLLNFLKIILESFLTWWQWFLVIQYKENVLDLAII